MIRFDIDSDISRAWTVPSAWYRDAESHDRCLDRIFRRSWHWLADGSDVRAPGTAHPTSILDRSHCEPLVVTRDREDHLRVLSNVCTHRGNLVVNAPCQVNELKCRYHGRRFSLDGTFRHMPEFGETSDFPTPKDDLVRIAHGSWADMIFGSIDPMMPFEEWIAPMDVHADRMSLTAMRHAPQHDRDYLVQAHWALYVENYLEGFHVPFVHAGLNDVLSYQDYRTELLPAGVLQIGTGTSPEHCFHGSDVAAYYYWLFPNLMLNVYPWGISMNIVRPLAIDRTRISYRTYIRDEERYDTGAGSDLDRVEREDEEIVEAVQKGMYSRIHDRGRYSVRREQGVHHFHRLLAREFGNGSGSRD